MSELNRATTQVVKCPTCGQYYLESEPHTCNAPETLKCAICGVNYPFGQVHSCVMPDTLKAAQGGAVSLPSDDPLVGMLIGDRYKILAKVGQGGMGAVYEAMQDSIERRVAIKVLLPAVAQDHEAAKRFINEARAVNRVNHPGLVQISDFGKLDSGTPYIVMEFLKGETLRQRMARLGGALPTAEVMELASQIAESLTAAHGMGIIHRERFTRSTAPAPSFQTLRLSSR